MVLDVAAIDISQGDALPPKVTLRVRKATLAGVKVTLSGAKVTSPRTKVTLLDAKLTETGQLPFVPCQMCQHLGESSQTDE